MRIQAQAYLQVLKEQREKEEENLEENDLKEGEEDLPDRPKKTLRFNETS